MHTPALLPSALIPALQPRGSARPGWRWRSRLLRLLVALLLCLAPLGGWAQSWSGQDIGSVNLSGSESFNAGTNAYTLQGAGADIQGGSVANKILLQ